MRCQCYGAHKCMRSLHMSHSHSGADLLHAACALQAFHHRLRLPTSLRPMPNPPPVPANARRRQQVMPERFMEPAALGVSHTLLSPACRAAGPPVIQSTATLQAAAAPEPIRLLPHLLLVLRPPATPVSRVPRLMSLLASMRTIKKLRGGLVSTQGLTLMTNAYYHL